MSEKCIPLTFPHTIDGGAWNAGHVQGIAVDEKNGFVYYSFTTILVKTDLEGHLISTVGGLVGHLGCIDFNPEDGCVYGSLEFKNDAIGQGIFKNLGKDGAPAENAFYIAVFDGARMTKPAMDAEQDGVMQAVYLPDVAEDFAAVLSDGTKHRYGCSGIDGISFGPVFGAAADSPRQLMVAYGIYGDVAREDNDYQVLLQFDWRAFHTFAKPLCQGAPHHSGPRAAARYFFYTGNTEWGVQNLCYDRATCHWLVSVYRGKKETFPNYPLFVIDGTKAPVKQNLPFYNGEEGLVLTAAEVGIRDEKSGIRGFTFPLGATGIHCLGEGYFYFSKNGRTPEPERLHTCEVRMYRYTGEEPEGFCRVP